MKNIGDTSESLESNFDRFSTYLVYHVKLCYIDLLVSLLFFTIGSQTRTLKKGNVTVLFILFRSFFPIPPPPLKSRFGEGMKNICILVFTVDKGENMAILVKNFEKNFNFTEKFKFSTCICFFVIQ